MTEPSSPPKGTVRSVEDLDDEGGTACSTSPDESPSEPQRPEDLIQAHFDNISTALIQAHFDNISTASSPHVGTMERSCRQVRGETNAPRADTNRNTKPGREEDADDDPCTYSMKKLVPEHDKPECSKSVRAPERWSGIEVASGQPIPSVGQSLPPSQHARDAGRMISATLDRPRNAIPYSGVPPDFVNCRKSALDPTKSEGSALATDSASGRLISTSDDCFSSDDEQLSRRSMLTKGKRVVKAAKATAADPVVPNPGVRPDFINPHARPPPPPALERYKRRMERKIKRRMAKGKGMGKGAAIVAAKSTGPLSEITESSRSSEERNKFEAEMASLTCAQAPSSKGSSSPESNSPESSSPESLPEVLQQPLLGGPLDSSVHSDDQMLHNEDRRGARQRAKERWQRVKNWTKKKCRIKKHWKSGKKKDGSDDCEPLL